MALHIGVIGLGGLGRMQAEVLDEMEDVELVGGADVSPDARAAFEQTFEVPTYEKHRRLLERENIDAVAIVTPHELHFDQVKDALISDIHVHVEKPLVTHSEDAIELISIAKDADLTFQVGYQRHFEPAYQEIRRIVTGGEIGTPHFATCYLGQSWIENAHGTWRMDPALSGGGQLIDSGSHLLDALLWTTDTKPRRVTALADERGFDVDINTAVSAELVGSEGSMLASIAVTGEGQNFSEQLTIWGTEGKVTYGSGGFVLERSGRPDAVIEPEGLGYQEGNRRKFRAFVDSIIEGTPSPVPAEYGLRVTQLTEAAYEAAEAGTMVEIESPGLARTPARGD